MVGPCCGSNKPAPEGRIIFGYPLDVNRQQAALSQLATYVAAYFGDKRFEVQVGFRETSLDGSFADHVAAAGWTLTELVVKELNEAP